MKYYQTGELEKLLGVKGHIIRYWEREIPIIQPVKDGRGKYQYSMRDVQLLLRIKHLLVDRKYTVEGAYEELLGEISGETQNLKAEIEAMRAELLNVYFLNHNRL
ncbi:MerR family transcriptional regulator [Spirochaetia bacterium]|nr:MerR family transcriptional regulator [Spirochaetia bacterium]GHV21300.1 MerR family transcriptional regulator [Spirochaetia bacterium]